MGGTHLHQLPVGDKLPPPYQEILDYILIDAARLQARISELGREISEHYSTRSNLTLIGILKGSSLFMADLMRQVTIPHTIDFMDVSSYGISARQTNHNVRIMMDLHATIENRDVLIVEDIIDSGYTLNQVLKLLGARNPASLKVCTLLDKHERREVEIDIAFTGFQIPNAFVFGYGLDIDEYYRNLPFIGVIKPDAVIVNEVPSSSRP